MGVASGISLSCGGGCSVADRGQGRCDGGMEKKLHRLLAEAVVGILREVFEQGAVADRAVGRVLGNHPKWGKRDRALVAESVYEVVRWRRRLEVLAGSGEVWAVAGFWWEQQGYARPEWAQWPVVETDVKAVRELGAVGESRAVRESLSDELDVLGEMELGAKWARELAAMNQAAPVFLRVNPRRGKLLDLQAELAAEGVMVDAVEGCPWGLRVLAGRAISRQWRERGRFEIQDAGSQQVAPFCEVKAGMRVVDACAGAGGKTLHLAALMEGHGDLLALDVLERKLETLRGRAARATVKVRTGIFSDAVVERNRGLADRVLVDAPCSGSGTLRRQADLKYRITAEGVAAVRAVQREVLAKSARMVRVGGKLVYATCSVFPSENEAQAAWFSAEHAGFVFEEERRISPAEMGWDGFYMARWRRVEI